MRAQSTEAAPSRPNPPSRPAARTSAPQLSCCVWRWWCVGTTAAVAKMLLEADGGAWAVVTQTKSDGKTPLHLACQHGQPELAHLLIERRPPRVKGRLLLGMKVIRARGAGAVAPSGATAPCCPSVLSPHHVRGWCVAVLAAGRFGAHRSALGVPCGRGGRGRQQHRRRPAGGGCRPRRGRAWGRPGIIITINRLLLLLGTAGGAAPTRPCPAINDGDGGGLPLAR